MSERGSEGATGGIYSKTDGSAKQAGGRVSTNGDALFLLGLVAFGVVTIVMTVAVVVLVLERRALVAKSVTTNSEIDALNSRAATAKTAYELDEIRLNSEIKKIKTENDTLALQFDVAKNAYQADQAHLKDEIEKSKAENERLVLQFNVAKKDYESGQVQLNSEIGKIKAKNLALSSEVAILTASRDELQTTWLDAQKQLLRSGERELTAQELGRRWQADRNAKNAVWNKWKRYEVFKEELLSQVSVDPNDAVQFNKWLSNELLDSEDKVKAEGFVKPNPEIGPE